MVAMENTRVASIVIAAGFWFLLVAIVVWDLYVSYAGRHQDTVSQILGEWSRRWPETLLVLGMLLHHLFGSR